MKTKITLFLISVLIFPILTNAQTLKGVFESSWKGASKSRTDLTDSKYFVCTEKMYNISYNESNNTFTGTALTTFNLDKKNYECKVNISGTYNTVTHIAIIKTGYRIKQDALPNGLYWIDTTISLTLYTDADHKGYYLLQGKTSNQSYSDEFYEISNYPY